MPTGVNAADTFCLDLAYSTTRLVTQGTPVFDKAFDVKFQSMLFLPPNPERKGEGGLRTKGYFKQSLPDKPLITVITVVFNGATYLEDTIKSVINQTYDNVEYIIIDGGSTDGTVDIIKRYTDRIDYWVSEKDGGIYDALNKGISLSQGVVLGHVHSDDVYFSDDILRKIAIIIADKQVDELFIISDTIIKTKEGNKVCKVNLEVKRYVNIPFIHTSLLITRRACKIIGLYDLRYSIASDIDYIMRLQQARIHFELCDTPICLMRDTGVSNTSYYKGRYEYAKIYHRYYKKKHLALFGYLYTVGLNMLYNNAWFRKIYRKWIK